MKLIFNRAGWAGQPITIAGRPGSSLAGKTRTVSEWGVLPTGDGALVVNENATISLFAEPEDPPRSISINGAAATLDPSLYANGPVCLKPPIIEKTTVSGTQAFRIVSRGIWSFDPALGGIHFWENFWTMNGNIHAAPDDVYVKTAYNNTQIFAYREGCTQGDLPPVYASSNTLQFT